MPMLIILFYGVFSWLSLIRIFLHFFFFSLLEFEIWSRTDTHIRFCLPFLCVHLWWPEASVNVTKLHIATVFLVAVS